MSTRKTSIQHGDMVLLRLLTGEIKSIKLEKNSIVSLGRVGAFHAEDLANEIYGITYEIVDKRLKVLPPRTLQEVEDTDATNELINDGEAVQPLTIEEIQTLKQSGTHANEIIQMQIEQHANYSLKTEYSKDKYRKRKEAKYLKAFTTIEPTLFNVCQYWFEKDQTRIRDIRVDSLSQLLNLASVHPGGRYLVVDDASGLVVAGIIDRLGGEGRLITISDSDSPPAYPVLQNMNFLPEMMEIHSSLNWATAQEEYTPIIPPTNVPLEQVKSERQKARLSKRIAVTSMLMNTREELFAGGFDGLIIATEYDSYSVLERLEPYVAGSGSIVIQSPHLHALAELQARLRSLPQYLSPSLTEGWLRQYQVLPGRTHPTMNTTGSGGSLLHTIKIIDDPEAEAIDGRSHRRKRAKIATGGIEHAQNLTQRTFLAEIC